MIIWDDHATLYGIEARIVFFDPEATRAASRVEPRLFPFIDTKDVHAMFLEADRKNFRFGGIVAQPDGVFAYKNGLISLEYKSRSGRHVSREAWREQVRIKDLLQCVMAGFLVAQVHRKLTACVLRYDNVALMLTPARAVVQTVHDLVPMAMSYHGETRDIAVSKLAAFASDRVRAEFGDVARASAAYGQKAHDDLLRRS